MKRKPPSLSYLEDRFILLAIVRVLLYNHQYAAPIQKFPVTSSAWTTHSDMRKDIHGRAVATWCEETGKDFTWFPYSVDFIARLYGKFKRTPLARLKRWEKSLKG